MISSWKLWEFYLPNKQHESHPNEGQSDLEGDQ